VSNHFHPAPPIVLTIAGFDPCGGAGTAADLKTIAAHNCYGIAAVTALTVQSTQGVKAVHVTPAATLRAQIETLLEDSTVVAVKIGMLGSRANATVVAEMIERFTLPSVVLDPVIQPSAGGVELMDAAGVKYLRDELLKRVALVTPNVPEAEALLGLEIRDVGAMEAAARLLVERGARAALVKGGHMDKPVDVLFDGAELAKFEGERVRGENTHGSGCTLSAAIAAQLAQGKNLHDAVLLAKVYVQKAMERAYPIGKGPGPLNHFFRMQAESMPRGVHAEELHPVQVPPSER
jgi:hydroxymethylpyrimidine kinase / phosphomethylpyrimidine kinase / thiamine-phosphate diphosphorylase